VIVNIKKVVHFLRFDPAAQTPPTIEYILFGSGSEIFLAHSIIKPPDFDQILSVQVDGLKPTGSAIRISIQTKGSSPADRLKEGEEAAADASDGTKFSVRGIREFYFEEGELRIPATFDPTLEEQNAGFSD